VFISKICTSYLRDAIDDDAEVRGNPGEQGHTHRRWSELADTSLEEIRSMLRVGMTRFINVVPPIGRASVPAIFGYLLSRYKECVLRRSFN
jgi:hypothetical protein